MKAIEPEERKGKQKSSPDGGTATVLPAGQKKKKEGEVAEEKKKTRMGSREKGGSPKVRATGWKQGKKG